MEYTLRKARLEDATAINNLFIEMLQTIYGTDDVNGYNDDDLDPYFSGGENWICVAEAEGQIIAYLAIEVHREEKDYLYYDDFCVMSDHRGKGIGTALINEAENFCRSICFDKTVLHVEKSNYSAQDFYRNKGFETLRDDGGRLCLIKYL